MKYVLSFASDILLLRNSLKIMFYHLHNLWLSFLGFTTKKLYLLESTFQSNCSLNLYTLAQGFG